MGDRAGAETLHRRAVDAGRTEALNNLAGLRQAADAGHAEALKHRAALCEAAGRFSVTVRWPYGLDPDGAPAAPWR